MERALSPFVRGFTKVAKRAQQDRLFFVSRVILALEKSLTRDPSFLGEYSLINPVIIVWSYR